MGLHIGNFKKKNKSNAQVAWLPGIEFVYLRVRMVRAINLK